MIVLLLVFGVLCLWGIKFSGYHDDFLSKTDTTPIKGIFTMLILYSHIRGYIQPSDAWYNAYYSTILDYLGQLIVAMFFFYSGFGIWESFKRKPGYVHSFFKNRFLKTLLHFDIAVAIFILVQLLIPITYSPKEYLLCWIGWESVGNSNWFIFVILSLYLIALAALFLQKRSGRGGIVWSILAAAGLWVLLRIVADRPTWWVDTMAAFPLGLIAGKYKNVLLSLLGRKGAPYLLTAASLTLFLLEYKFAGIDIYGGAACLFCILVVFCSSWIKIGNPVLDWLGKNAFTIYIIQRLPMIVCSELGLNARIWLFIPVVFCLTFLLAEGLSRLYAKMDAKLFSNA